MVIYVFWDSLLQSNRHGLRQTIMPVTNVVSFPTVVAFFCSRVGVARVGVGLI